MDEWNRLYAQLLGWGRHWDWDLLLRRRRRTWLLPLPLLLLPLLLLLLPLLLLPLLLQQLLLPLLLLLPLRRLPLLRLPHHYSRCRRLQPLLLQPLILWYPKRLKTQIAPCTFRVGFKPAIPCKTTNITIHCTETCISAHGN